MKIEVGIPMPPAKTAAKPRWLPDRQEWPFVDMQVGDSVRVELGELKRAVNAARGIGTRRGWKFSARVVEEEGQRRYGRVWRVA
jgi:hypothetical protein